MAAAEYTVAGSYQTVQVLSSTDVAPVQRVAIYTKPHGSRVVVNVPLSAFEDGHSDAYLQPVAANIEDVWTHHLISGTQAVQDSDPQTGLLTDYVDFTVSYTPTTGYRVPSTGIVRVPVSALATAADFSDTSDGESYSQQLGAKYLQLSQLAGT